MEEQIVKKRRRIFSPKQRQEIVERFHQSGQRRREFAHDHGIGESTLTKWIQRLSRTAANGTVSEIVEHKSATCELAFVEIANTTSDQLRFSVCIGDKVRIEATGKYELDRLVATALDVVK